MVNFLLWIWSKWNFDKSLTWLIINQLLNHYRAYIVHQKDPIYEFSKEFINFEKFNKFMESFKMLK